MFRCEDDRYDGIVFGAFDGVREWHVNAFITTEDLVEQELVSAHEERHLRLQQGTPYGAALAILGGAAQTGDYPMDDWLARVDACRTTHETYATYMSVANVRDGLDCLTGNLRYLEYWRTGQVLHRSFETAGASLRVLELIFHQLMSPQPRTGTSGHLGPAIDMVSAQSPDDRLNRVVTLVDDRPSFVGAVLDAATADDAVESAMDRLADVLNEAGLPTQTAAGQEQTSRHMQETFNAGTTTHVVTLTLRSRATSLEDQMDYLSRETVRLQDKRLPLTYGFDGFPDGAHPFSVLKRDDDKIGPHLWTVMLSGRALKRQFAIELDDDSVHFGFLSCDRRSPDGRAFFLPVSAAPDQATRDLAEVGLRTLLMTTLSSLAGVVRQTSFSDTEPLFVLVDEQVRAFLLGMQDQPVLWTTVAVTGDRLLHAVILTTSDGKSLHFVWVGTIYALKSVLEWLHRHNDSFTYVGSEYPDVHAELFAMLRHLVGSFAVLTTAG